MKKFAYRILGYGSLGNKDGLGEKLVNNKKEVIRMIKFMLFSISAVVIEGIVFGKATDTKETISCYQIEE